ncbi:MAG: hypothetical protein ACPG3S_04565 [Schleiferiaceae bacterium]
MKSKIFVLLGIGLFVACSTPEKQGNTKSKGWQPEMDQPSELASIMRVLHDEATERKGILEKGEMAVANSQLIFKMITAKPTEPHMVGPAFEPHAQAFIASYGQLNTAENVQGQIEAHNNLVKSCVACHMNFCQGPIPRIEKLYVQ